MDDNTLLGGGGWAPTGHQWSLAWALHAGAGIQVTNNLTLDLGYSFVSLGDAKTGSFQNQDPNIACVATGCPPMTFKSLYSHDFKLGLRWAYDQPSYYPPVVKY
jgi:opacity protein-like surface antigen